MRSRYQGACFDTHIHLFMYNIIDYCLQDMRTCYTYNLIKGGHGRPPSFFYSNPYQKTLALSSTIAHTPPSITITNNNTHYPNATAHNILTST